MKPMLCNTSVVQNILAGRQTQDRRPMKPQPKEYEDRIVYKTGKYSTLSIPKPDAILPINAKYQVGDIIYVRERIDYRPSKGNFYYHGDDKGVGHEIYLKLYGRFQNRKKAIPSIHMPKDAARIFLKVTNVRCERVQDISRKDVIAEGIEFSNQWADWHYKEKFKELWESIYPGSYDKNEFVFVYDFELTDKP